MAGSDGVELRAIKVRETPLGPALHVKIRGADRRPLAWREVWECFSAHYPGRWAVQSFPPAEELVDGKAVYHLFVLPPDFEPAGLNIKV